MDASTTASDLRGVASIPGYMAVVRCSACEIRTASQFVAVTMEIVGGDKLRVRRFQMPLCDVCGALVGSVKSGRQMARALAQCGGAE